MDFNGRLNSNEIFASLYNAIISIRTFADNISISENLVNSARQDGTLYGDTKLYLSTDVLSSYEWKGDEEAPNLLKLHRPKEPKVQAITLNKFRYIPLTVDYYLSKRAFMDEGSFSSYTSVLLSWLNETKKLYDVTLYNTFIGTNETDLNGQLITFEDVSKEVPTTLDDAKREALNLANDVANLVDDLSDLTRQYTDYGFARSFDKSRIKIIWNKKYLNRIKNIDLPTIYHNDLFNNLFGEYSLNPKYFGKKNNGDTQAGNGIRLLSEEMFDDGTDRFGGELVPIGKSSSNTYTEDDSIICKIVIDLPPLMSSFQVGTSFYNPLSLTENKYLIFGFNTLEHLKNYPFITVRAKSNE